MTVPEHVRKAAANVATNLDRALVEEALALYDAGWAPMQIASRMPVSRGTVNNWRRLSGLPANGSVSHDKLLSAREIARTVELYERDGLSMKQVAEAVGRSEAAVHTRLVKAGAQIRRTGAPDAKARPVMPAGFLSVREAADIVGLAHETLRRRVTAGKVPGAIQVPNDRQGPALVWAIPEGVARELRRARRPKLKLVVKPEPSVPEAQLVSGRQDRWLPAGPLAEWVARQEQDETTLAALSGVPQRRLYAIRVGEQEHITLSLADRLLTANGGRLEDVWPDIDELLAA